jgi:hypothetical protein
MTRCALRNELCAYNCANMFNKVICALGLLVFFLPNAKVSAFAQGATKPLDPNDLRLTFSFPIHSGGNPFHFKVKLDKVSGAIVGVSVIRTGQAAPIQTLPACQSANLMPDVSEDTTDPYISEILKHADLNFDGYEDLELVSNFSPRLDCIYLWDNKAGRFRYSKKLSDDSEYLEVHPENKTLTTSAYFGGPSEERTYRWKSGELELIEMSSLEGGWDNPVGDKCLYAFTCRRLFHGKMTVTFEKDICTADETFNLPTCPAAATFTVPKKIAAQPPARKKH